MADFIPGADNDFEPWQTNFVTYAQAHPQDLGLTPEQLATLTTGQTDWQNAYNTHLQAQTTAQSAHQQKDDIRSTFEQLVRTLARQLQSNPTVTNSQRVALGLTVSTGTRTATSIPTTRPLATLSNPGAYRHTINFVDESTPTRRAKPDGVMGAEIWVKVGDPAPKSPSELTFLGLDTQTPYIAEFEATDSGKTAYYQLRWVNRKGEQGPWSTLTSGMIIA